MHSNNLCSVNEEDKQEAPSKLKDCLCNIKRYRNIIQGILKDSVLSSNSSIVSEIFTIISDSHYIKFTKYSNKKMHEILLSYLWNKESTVKMKKKNE